MEDEDYVWASEILFKDQIKDMDLIIKQQKYILKKQNAKKDENEEEKKLDQLK